MNDRLQLVAYLATLATLVVVFIAALIVAAIQPSIIGRLEAFGLGTITGGLIGVLRLPTVRTPVSNVESAGTVIAATPSTAGAGQAAGDGPTA